MSQTFSRGEYGRRDVGVRGTRTKKHGAETNPSAASLPLGKAYSVPDPDVSRDVVAGRRGNRSSGRPKMAQEVNEGDRESPLCFLFFFKNDGRNDP